MCAEDHLGTPNILDSSRYLLEYLYEGLTRPRSITFSFVSSISDTSILLELCFQDFSFVFLILLFCIRRTTL